MSAVFSVALLVAIVGTMLMLPLLPALRELRDKSDATPLNVVQQNAGEVRHFADGFRLYLKGLDRDLQRAASSGMAATGTLPDGTSYMVLGRSDDNFPIKNGVCSTLLAANGDLSAPSGSTFSRDIYTTGNFVGGENNHYRAILAEKNMHLGASSHVTRWLHAVEELSAGSGCRLLGRISSDRLVRLQSGCRFTRVHAPQIVAGSLANEHLARIGNHVGTQIAHSTDRFLYEGDLTIETRDVIHANIVVRGTLTIGAGARVCGSLKSGKDIILESGVSVEGSLISARHMRVGPNCFLTGPMIAERGMSLGTATVCGSRDRPTTVTSPVIEVAEGVLTFGTLWARESGRVVGT